MKKVSSEIIDLLWPLTPKKNTFMKFKEDVMMDEAMSFLKSEKSKWQYHDETIGMAIDANLRLISNIQNKEFAKLNIQEIIFQAHFRNSMAPFAPNHMTQTLPITFPTGV